MDLIKIKELLKKHEGLTLEYKLAQKSLPDDFWRTYSAFANTVGGDVILGIKEDEHRNAIITGVSNAEKIKTELFAGLSNKNKVNNDLIKTENVMIFTIDNKDIIYIHISEATLQQKPIYLNNNLESTYIRKHDGDHKVSKEELSSLIRNQSESLDSELLSGYTLNDLDIESIVKYQAILHKRYPTQNFLEKKPIEFLTNIGAFQYDYSDERKLKLTLGSLLFFGKYNAIISRIPHYHVDFFDKRGNNERWSDRISSGDFDFPDLNLFNYYTLVLEKLLSSIERPFKFEDKSITRKAYSELDVALRETFVNMITHADYLSNTTALIVEIHDPYYIFTNPGIMKIPVDSFFKGSFSKARNNILVQLFTRMGAAERAGSGSQKILNVIVKNNFKEPEITTSLEKTIFKLWICNVIDQSSNLTGLEKAIYTLLDDEESKHIKIFSTSEICSILSDFSRPQITRALRKLVEKNLIEKLGANRNRRYIKKISSLEAMKIMDDSVNIMKKLFK